jgi:hypothetical protein
MELKYTTCQNVAEVLIGHVVYFLYKNIELVVNNLHIK